MTGLVTELPLIAAEHVFALRQSGRVAAAAIGCDEADQVRFATALSELGREALAHGARAAAAFGIADDGSLVVEIERFPRAALAGKARTGLDAARKLVGDVTVTDASDPRSVTVTLRRAPSGAKTQVSAAALRAELLRAVAPGPLEDLRLENQDLVSALEEVNAKQDELVRLNGELEETNRGVMAMYAQLADELEETNRGVVALYAELDDKTVRLNEASEAKSRFLASVSHELRSPVNSVLGLTRLLLDPSGGALSEAQRKELSLIHGSAAELLGLVNELLDLAKAESGRLDPQIAPVDLADVFSELRGALRPLVRAGVELRVESPRLPPVETDRTLLTHVLRNLLANAVKFTTHGTVTLSARLSAPYRVELAVSDTGVGIAPADQPRVFEEFFQVRGPLQADQNGTGLGLPYARRVTETLGGQMRLESEVGRGSTFTVELPAHWEPLLGTSRSPGRGDAGEVRIATVLIVDDDDGFRVVLRGMLQGSAGHVIEARGGVEGLHLMRTARPDLAFVDLRMPDMDGAAVLAEMSADPVLQAIPVVIVTSAELTPGVRSTLRPATALLAKSNVNRQSVQLALVQALGPQSLQT
jgi:signal transduction histidine kinase/ActR/RegA family two-component response regulator